MYTFHENSEDLKDCFFFISTVLRFKKLDGIKNRYCGLTKYLVYCLALLLIVAYVSHIYICSIFKCNWNFETFTILCIG